MYNKQYFKICDNNFFLYFVALFSLVLFLSMHKVWVSTFLPVSTTSIQQIAGSRELIYFCLVGGAIKITGTGDLRSHGQRLVTYQAALRVFQMFVGDDLLLSSASPACLPLRPKNNQKKNQLRKTKRYLENDLISLNEIKRYKIIIGKTWCCQFPQATIPIN